MSLRQLFQPSRAKLTLQTINLKVSEVTEKIRSVQFPERLKGTILERWAIYWKGLYGDYKEVAVSVVEDCKVRPVRASIYSSILVSCFYLTKHNPDEQMFKEQIIGNMEKVLQVGETTRNPVSEQHVKWLDRCYNEGTVRRFSLGLFSIIWLDNYDELCALYKASCPYLKPKYLTFYERIIDVGFLDKWWVIEDKMKDYDVNEGEFPNVIV